MISEFADAAKQDAKFLELLYGKNMDLADIMQSLSSINCTVAILSCIQLHLLWELGTE